MSRRKWSKEARQRARVRRAQKLLSVPVLAERLDGVDPPQQARVEHTKPHAIVGTARGAQKSFEYQLLRGSFLLTATEWNGLGSLGWEYVGMDNQGWLVFKREQ